MEITPERCSPSRESPSTSGGAITMYFKKEGIKRRKRWEESELIPKIETLPKRSFLRQLMSPGVKEPSKEHAVKDKDGMALDF